MVPMGMSLIPFIFICTNRKEEIEVPSSIYVPTISWSAEKDLWILLEGMAKNDIQSPVAATEEIASAKPSHSEAFSEVDSHFEPGIMNSYFPTLLKNSLFPKSIINSFSQKWTSISTIIHGATKSIGLDITPDDVSQSASSVSSSTHRRHPKSSKYSAQDSEEVMERKAIFEDIKHFKSSVYRYFSTSYLPPYFSYYFRAPEFSPLENALSFYRY